MSTKVFKLLNYTLVLALIWSLSLACRKQSVIVLTKAKKVMQTSAIKEETPKEEPKTPVSPQPAPPQPAPPQPTPPQPVEKKKCKYKVKITATDANTTKVWQDTVGHTRYDQSRYNYCSLSHPNDLNYCRDQATRWIFDIPSSTTNSSLKLEPLTQDYALKHLASSTNSNPNDAKISKVLIKDKNGKEITVASNKQVGETFEYEFEVSEGETISLEAEAEQTGEVSSPTEVANVGRYAPNFKNFIVGTKIYDATVSLKIEILKDGTVVKTEEDKKVAKANKTVSFSCE